MNFRSNTLTNPRLCPFDNHWSRGIIRQSNRDREERRRIVVSADGLVHEYGGRSSRHCGSG